MASGRWGSRIGYMVFIDSSRSIEISESLLSTETNHDELWITKDYKKSEDYKIVIADANQSIDMSDAFEVCEAMIQALEFKIPQDYVIASEKAEKIYKIIRW